MCQHLKKYRGKDPLPLQIPRLSENEPPSVLYCKFLGGQDEKSEQASTTVTISNLNCEEPEKVISKLMTNFGRVSSSLKEILFGEGGPEILISVGSGTYVIHPGS